MIKRLIPWVFIAATVGVLVGLGSWQLQRLAWKEKLMAQYEAGQTLPALKLEEVPSDALTEHAYRRVIFSGQFMHDKEVHLGGRRWHGKSGYNLLTPMKVSDGRIFMVNRGWVPFELKERENRQDSLPKGTSSLKGVIRIPKEPHPFAPDNHPDKNFWFYVDFPAIEDFTGIKTEKVMLEVTEAEPNIDQFPIPSDGKRVFRNDHLGYAITWFTLAIAALIMFFVRIRR